MPDQQMSFGRALYLLYGEERGFTEKQCTDIAALIRRATVHSCVDRLREVASELRDDDPFTKGIRFSAEVLEKLR